MRFKGGESDNDRVAEMICKRGSSHMLTIFQRSRIITLLSQKTPVPSVSRTTGVNETTIRRLRKKFLETGKVVDRKRAGRPRKLAKTIITSIVRGIRAGRLHTSFDMVRSAVWDYGVVVTAQTIRSSLESMGI